VVNEQAKEQDGCEKVVVIQRDTCALDSIASSKHVIIGGHNEFGIIQFYERL
jgi:translation initiation factor RLI1